MKTITLFYLFALIIQTNVFAQEYAYKNNGEKIQLNNDGTWINLGKPHITVYTSSNCNSNNKVINLSGKDLTYIPIWALNETVETLDLSNNKITNISSYISECKNLKTLILSNNQIESITSYIGSCKLLQTLDLSDNNISSLTSYIGDCASLTTLYLNNNKDLSSLTSYLENCSNLKQIEVINTKIKYVPSFVRNKSEGFIFKY